MGKTTRLNILLHEDNQYENRTIKFLQNCGRKKGEILSVIISCFIEDTELNAEVMQREDLYEFFRLYPVMRKASKTTTAILPQQTEKEPEKAPPKPRRKPKESITTGTKEPEQPAKKPEITKVNTAISEESEDRGRNALAAFGI